MLTFAIVLPLAGTALQSEADLGESRPPNILVLVADDVAWEDLDSVYTPNIDRVAARGLRFTGFHSMPLCSPTRVAILTGRWPRRMGIGDSIDSYAPPDPDDNPTPPSELATLPKLLKQRGYRTCLVGKWHMGQASWTGTPQIEDAAGGPHAQGFDHWLAGSPGNVNRMGSGYEDWLRVDDGQLEQNETDYATRAMRDAALQWWVSTHGPKFLVVSLQAAHAPFHVPPPDMLPQRDPGDPIDTKDEMYRAMIQSVDTVLGDLLAHVAADDWTFFLSDNGTPPGVNGGGTRVKGTTLKRGLNVPLIVAGPGIPYAGEEVSALVSCVDLYATMAGLAGTGAPPASSYLGGEDSLSFAEAFERGSSWQGAREWVFSERYGMPQGGVPTAEDVMVRNRRWKLRQLRDDQLPDQDLLYDLANDPEERSPWIVRPGELGPDQQAAYDALVRILERLPPRL